MPIEEGTLPVRYLGVPLIASGLRYKDCKILLEWMENRISSWRHKLLSFAGRVQLILSVLSSMHIYWASVFMLQIKVIKDLGKMMRNFLWSNDSLTKGKAKVAWKDVCVPKHEGGLGIRRIRDMNKALIVQYVSSIVCKQRSLWVDWVYAYRLKHVNFWECSEVSDCFWSWSKLLQIRPSIRHYFWHNLGNGRNTSAWYDNWCEGGP